MVLVVATGLAGGTLLIDHYRDTEVPRWDVFISEGGALAASGHSTEGSEVIGDSQEDTVPLETLVISETQDTLYLDPDEYSSDAVYRVRFIPYGVGPAPDSLVIAVLASEPQGDVALPFDFTGFDAVVNTSRLPESEQVSRVGTYEGTLVVEERKSDLGANGFMVLMLVEAFTVE